MILATRYSEYGRIRWHYSLADFTRIRAYVERAQHVELRMWDRLWKPAANDETFARGFA